MEEESTGRKIIVVLTCAKRVKTKLFLVGDYKTLFAIPGGCCKSDSCFTRRKIRIYRNCFRAAKNTRQLPPTGRLQSPILRRLQ